jgi:glycosyltransferase involved in cell wall biosynthesis
MKKKINIVYLWEILTENNKYLIEELIKKNCNVTVISRNKQKKKFFFLPKIRSKNFKIFLFEKFHFFSLLKFLKNRSPDIVVVCGWFSIYYLIFCFYFRLKNTQVVLVCDNVWSNIFRQKVVKYLSIFKISYIFFSKVWIPGPPSLSFVKNLGFKDKDILMHFHPANIKIFSKDFKKNLIIKKKKYPKNFLFVGRFVEKKGLKTLIEAWKNLKDKKGWRLQIIGSGDLDIDIKNIEAVSILKFTKHNKMIKLLKSIGCFVCPSYLEEWGIVVQEFASAGIPLILSDGVLSKDYFLIKGKNGFLFKSGNVKSLNKSLKKIINLSNNKLIQMSTVSHELSKKISPNISAKSLICAAKV